MNLNEINPASFCKLRRMIKVRLRSSFAGQNPKNLQEINPASLTLRRMKKALLRFTNFAGRRWSRRGGLAALNPCTNVQWMKACIHCVHYAVFYFKSSLKLRFVSSRNKKSIFLRKMLSSEWSRRGGLAALNPSLTCNGSKSFIVIRCCLFLLSQIRGRVLVCVHKKSHSKGVAF